MTTIPGIFPWAPRIRVPAVVADLMPVISASGGKDSSAVLLAARDAGIPFRAVFADTGWEAPETYEHLDNLRRLIGPIDVVKPALDMRAAILKRAGFPARMQRWCTRELKLNPLREYHDAVIAETGRETLSIVGVRAEESDARALMRELEDEPEWQTIVEDDGTTRKVRAWGGFVWRPLLRWSVEDVIAIHRRHNVPMNPLYHAGFDRVGCMPCIFARKEEIRLMSERYPERVAEIEALEAAVTAERDQRNGAKPGRYKNMEGTFFQTRRTKHKSGFVKIRDVVAWSRTDKGGRQFSILQDPPSGGCMRWGLCEAPPTETR